MNMISQVSTGDRSDACQHLAVAVGEVVLVVADGAVHAVLHGTDDCALPRASEIRFQCTRARVL